MDRPSASVVRLRVVLGLALVVMVALAYSSVVDAGFIWDDDQYVTKNNLLASPRGLLEIWVKPTASPQYYPLVHTVFWIQRRLWGLAPLGYHVTNVLIHSANALLLWSILRLLTIPGAWLGAALWALHPIQVESVAWITELKNLLSGFFALATALVFLRRAGIGRGDRGGAGEPPEGRQWSRGLVLTLLFVCGLLSKTIVATLPFVLAAVIWWKRERLRRDDILRLAPLAAMGAIMGAVTAYLERYRVGAVGEEWSFSAADRLIIAGRAFWFYLGKLAWPAQFAFFYRRWEIDSGRWWQYLFPAAAIILLQLLWQWRRRLGRGPLVAVLAYGITLSPALGFLNVYPMRYSFVADHFQYLAGIAPLAILAAALQRISRRASFSAVTAASVAALLLMPLGFQTWRQTRAYRNLEMLWRDTILKTPTSWAAHLNLATLLNSQGRDEEALLHYREVVRLHPGDAMAATGMGLVLVRQGRVSEAEALYQEASRNDPGFYLPFLELGKILLDRGKAWEAEAYFRRAIWLKPERPPPHFYLGQALVASGRAPEALAHYRQAITLEPNSAQYRYQLGVALLSLGKFGEARDQLLAVLQIDPNHQAARASLYRIRDAGPSPPL